MNSVELVEATGEEENSRSSSEMTTRNARADAEEHPLHRAVARQYETDRELQFAAWFAAFLLLLFAVASVGAQSTVITTAPRSNGDVVSIVRSLTTSANPAATSLAAYVSKVRTDNAVDRPTAGSIWTENGRLTRISTDVHAMRPHDLISVVVSESLAASTDGTVKNTRASNASSQISSLIGALHTGNALQNLVNQTSSSGLNAAGASATNSSLTTTFGGQVVEVLPNGTLVIEAARQVTFSQQTQTIILRGLVRPEDVSQQNQVLSTAISSLELEVKGKGIVNDYTHRQNALVRLLMKVLVF
jgi:flagellar L-ring protein precursor FlgH